jgi:carbamoyl-phosphate synthase large subunit
MAIGRSFQEALQKACQSLEINRNGLGADAKSWSNQDQILDRLKNPSWDRVFRIYDAMRIGIPKNTIQQMTGIDNWFLSQIEEMVSMERVLETYNIKDLPRELLLDAKMKGYADRQIAHLTRCWESEVHTKRIAQGINRVYKLVDTCAAEFEAQTPYYYSTFENEIEINGKRFTENEVSVSDKKKVIVLGSGPNRIGQGIEFDYCCVHGVLAAKEMGYETIMINCNPETVSTDFDTADQLFFEPVFWEHIYDIIKMVQPEGVIVQLGGQTALKLAEKLEKYGVKILGTSFKALDLAEDRGRFSELLASENIPYPELVW